VFTAQLAGMMPIPANVDFLIQCNKFEILQSVSCHILVKLKLHLNKEPALKRCFEGVFLGNKLLAMLADFSGAVN